MTFEQFISDRCYFIWPLCKSMAKWGGAARVLILIFKLNNSKRHEEETYDIITDLILLLMNKKDTVVTIHYNLYFLL